MSSTALTWIKSSYSGSEGGNCVEVAVEPATIHIRDSKTDTLTAPRITVAPEAWAAFLAW
ncbi:DUF397 domain-containing protein [Streptomyces sp. NPDC047829]|jgi:hypothetical protein|uniref:DUF397 domain-containing protein n=1 Tax=Streptomyces sp. NPDC047829 TaxID=3154609 RepID=UPI00340E96C5